MIRKNMRPRSRRNLSLFCAALSLSWAAIFPAGCAHGHKCAGVGQQAVSISKPFESVWTAVVREASGLSPSNVVDRLTGSVNTPEIVLTEDVVTGYACAPKGLGTYWTSSKLLASFTVTARSPAETEVAVACRFFRFDTSADEAWRLWLSNGRIEQQLLSNIVTRASQ